MIANVYLPDEAYSGPYVDKAPDLVVGYNANYRASWDTVLGKYPKEQISDNTDPWSGDHVLDSIFMSGSFLCNRKINTKHPALLDLAPSILNTCGAPIPKEMTGQNIWTT